MVPTILGNPFFWNEQHSAKVGSVAPPFQAPCLAVGASGSIGLAFGSSNPSVPGEAGANPGQVNAEIPKPYTPKPLNP